MCRGLAGFEGWVGCEGDVRWAGRGLGGRWGSVCPALGARSTAPPLQLAVRQVHIGFQGLD